MELRKLVVNVTAAPANVVEAARKALVFPVSARPRAQKKGGHWAALGATRQIRLAGARRAAKP